MTQVPADASSKLRPCPLAPQRLGHLARRLSHQERDVGTEDATSKSGKGVRGTVVRMNAVRAALCLAFGAALLVACAALAGAQSADRARPRTISKHAAALTGIACTSPNRCMAVGDYYSEPPLRHGTLVSRWNGRAWQRERAPLVGPVGIVGVAVSCPVARRCVAVSTSGAMAWNGTRWTSQRGVTGSAVSCPSARFCAAVGTQGLALSSSIWRDGRWTRERVPLPTPPTPIGSITLAGVSCTSQDFCLAVGDYSYPAEAQPSAGHRDVPLAELWNGNTWRLVPPAAPTALGALRAVSCRSPRFCVAVGTQRARSTLVERWTGKDWQVQASPNPSAVGYSVLDAVACPSTRTCEAVGTYNGGSLVAESWRKDRWVLQRVRTPRPMSGSPALSCPSTRACVLVGAVGGLPMSQTWDGRRWVVRSTPRPPR